MWPGRIAGALEDGVSFPEFAEMGLEVWDGPGQKLELAFARKNDHFGRNYPLLPPVVDGISVDSEMVGKLDRSHLGDRAARLDGHRTVAVRRDNRRVEDRKGQLGRALFGLGHDQNGLFDSAPRGSGTAAA